MVNVKPVQLGKTKRMSFGKIEEVLKMPNLIEIQKKSYEWFLNEGLREVFRDVSGITDFNNNLVLDFVDYKLDETPNYSVTECKERDATYSAALRVTARLLNKETGEIKVSEVFMGDFPLMTQSGTFVINGAERVIVSQLVRSPGVYYKMDYDRSGKELFSSTIIPNRGAWLEYENDVNDVLYVRIDKNRKIPITVFVRCLGLGTDQQILDFFGEDDRIRATMEKDTCHSMEEGLFEIQAKAVILAMGCRERARGALNIPGYRPAGIFSAGTAQRLVNMEGYMPGRKVVILGSGDIGLIMARRMTLEGAKVQVVAELMPYSGGLKRNIVQCLDDFGIPLKLSHTVVDIRGKYRVEGITIAEVDSHGKPVPGTEEDYDCDTLLLSCGLIPENELSRGMGVDIEPVTSGPSVNESLETNIDGVFACGNVLHVHDLVDYVSEEATTAGHNAAKYVQGSLAKGSGKEIRLVPTGGVRYTVPKTIDVDRMAEELTVRFRVGNVYKNCFISVYFDDEQVVHRKRPVMAPGEMEDVKFKKEKLASYPDLKTITIKIEEA